MQLRIQDVSDGERQPLLFRAKTYYYRPKFAKVMFSHVSVCPWEECVANLPLGQTPTQVDIPLGRYRLGRHSPGRQLAG